MSRRCTGSIGALRRRSDTAESIGNAGVRSCVHATELAWLARLTRYSRISMVPPKHSIVRWQGLVADIVDGGSGRRRS